MPRLSIWRPAEAGDQGAEIQLEEGLESEVVCPVAVAASPMVHLEAAAAPVAVEPSARHAAHNATLTVRCEGSVAKLAWRVAIRSRTQNGSTDSAAESASQFHLPRAASSYPL